MGLTPVPYIIKLFTLKKFATIKHSWHSEKESQINIKNVLWD